MTNERKAILCRCLQCGKPSDALSAECAECQQSKRGAEHKAAKALKYHDRLVAALRAMLCPSEIECSEFCGSLVCHESRALLAEIVAEQS